MVQFECRRQVVKGSGPPEAGLVTSMLPILVMRYVGCDGFNVPCRFKVAYRISLSVFFPDTNSSHFGPGLGRCTPSLLQALRLCRGPIR